MEDQIAVNGRLWQIERLLGKGKGGYSYLVADGALRYVVKQLHHEPCDYYQFGDKLAAELDAYERLRKLNVPMPELLEVDRQAERLRKQYIDGPTVAELAQRGENLEPWLAQIRALCPALYAAGINIDYYPTNFIPSGGVLYYVDYEYSSYSDQWNFANWGEGCWRKGK